MDDEIKDNVTGRAQVCIRKKRHDYKILFGENGRKETAWEALA